MDIREDGLAVSELVFRGHNYHVVHDPQQSHMLFTHVDEDVVRQRWWDIQPGDVVLDIGAAFGSYTLTALACGASYVLAWSPQGDAPFLQKSIELNGWRDSAAVLNTGLWSKPGYIRVFDGSPMSVYLGESTPPDIGGDKNVIRVHRLDDVVPVIGRIDRINWIKIDVEGAEAEVLEGGRTTIERYRPKMLIENHEFKSPSLRPHCAAILGEYGYREVGTVPHHGVSHSLYTASG